MFPRTIRLSSLLSLLVMTQTPHFHALSHGNRWTAGSTVITHREISKTNLFTSSMPSAMFTGACGPPEKLSLALVRCSHVLHVIVKLAYRKSERKYEDTKWLLYLFQSLNGCYLKHFSQRRLAKFVFPFRFWNFNLLLRKLFLFTWNSIFEIRQVSRRNSVVLGTIGTRTYNENENEN